MVWGSDDNLIYDVRDGLTEGVKTQGRRVPLSSDEGYGLAVKLIAYLKQRGWKLQREKPDWTVGGVESGRPPGD